MTAVTTEELEKVERYFRLGHKLGCPRDQMENLWRAGLVLQERQLAACAAARLCDAQDGPTSIGFGGARGGGKSHWLLAQMGADDCQRVPGLKCLLLRKVGKANMEHFEDLRKRLFSRLPHEFAAYRGILTFANGSRIIAGHFQSESDIDAYLGLEYDVIGIEEATTLTHRKYVDISTCCRSSKPLPSGLSTLSSQLSTPYWRPRIYSTTNPGGIGHAWYKEMFVVPYIQSQRNLIADAASSTPSIPDAAPASLTLSIPDAAPASLTLSIPNAAPASLTLSIPNAAPEGQDENSPGSSRACGSHPGYSAPKKLISLSPSQGERAGVRGSPHNAPRQLSTLNSQPSTIPPREAPRQLSTLNSQPSTLFIPARVTDNEFNNPEYRQVLERLTGWQRRAWLDGDWDIQAGQFFRTFRREAHVLSDFDDTRAVDWFAALDYGFTHYTVVLLGCRDGDGNTFIVDEHAERLWLPERHTEAIRSMLARHGVRPQGSSYRGAAGGLSAFNLPLSTSTLSSQLSTLSSFVAGADVFSRQSDGQTIAEQYRRLGIHLRVANTERINGWAEVLSRLGDPAAGVPARLFIHERCGRLIETLPALQHDPTRPEDVLKVDADEEGRGGDDAADTLRYLLATKHHTPGAAVI